MCKQLSLYVLLESLMIVTDKLIGAWRKKRNSCAYLFFILTISNSEKVTKAEIEKLYQQTLKLYEEYKNIADKVNY